MQADVCKEKLWQASSRLCLYALVVNVLWCNGNRYPGGRGISVLYSCQKHSRRQDA